MLGVRGPAGERAFTLAGADGPAASAWIAASYDGLPRVRVEDAYSIVELTRHGLEVDLRMAVMARAGGEPPDPGAGTIDVTAVREPEALREAEIAIAQGFPSPDRSEAPGAILAPAMLDVPGHQVWLAHRDGEPAGAVTTYDDGASLGVYLLATLRAHRRRGVGRALMAAALAAAPARPAVLTATAAGEPLYAALGFEIVGRPTWWRRPQPGAAAS